MKHRRYITGDTVRVHYGFGWDGLATVIDDEHDEIVSVRMNTGTEFAGSKGAFLFDQLSLATHAPWSQTDNTIAAVNLMRDLQNGRSHGRHERRAVA